ncbi:MAG: CAP domain-containing protein [Alphaproteobacteria bacterium]
MRIAIPASSVGLALACTLALLAAHSRPAAASEGDFGSYFERLPSGMPPIPQRAALPRAKTMPLRGASLVVTARLDTATLEQSAFTHINLHRLSLGMRPLDSHSGLADRARAHSANMASGAAPMNHDGMRDRLGAYLGGLFGYRGGGEILAFNRNMGDPARTAMMSWLNSYRHKDIIEEDHRRMGVGVAMRPDGGYYFTVLFLR